MSDQGATGGDIYVISTDGGVPMNFTAGSAASPAWIQWTAKEHLIVSSVANGSSEVSENTFTFPPSFHAPGNTHVLTTNLLRKQL